MDETSGKTSSAPNGSACELCHQRKVKCNVHTGKFPCTHCRTINQPCVPHRRKRKHGLPISPSTPKRHDFGPAALTPAPRSESVSTVTPDIAHPRLSVPQDEGEASPGSYLGRAEYVSGTVPIDEEDAKRYSSGRSTSLQNEDKRYLESLRAFDLPSRALYDSLVSSFMDHCYPWMPMVEPHEVRATDEFQPSPLLLQSMFVAASRVSLAPDAREAGTRFYRRAKALFHLGYEKGPLDMVRSICLLLWFNNSGPEHISLDASSFWLHMGVALAHQVGLHREPHSDQADAKLRRRIWWTIFIRDCQIATSHGRPRMINPEDCTVRPLTLDDFPRPSNDARLFLAYLDICSILADLTESLVRGTLGYTKLVTIETKLLSWICCLPESLRICNKDNGTLLPYNFKCRQLNVMFFTAVMLLFRPASPGVMPSTAALLASSFSAGIFEDFLARGELGFLAPVFNFHLMTAAYAQLACFKFPILWAKAEGELKIISKCLIEMAKRYPTAIGAQRVIKAVFRTVSSQKRHESEVGIAADPKEMTYFASLGPDLCSKWALVTQSCPPTVSRTLPPLRPHTTIAPSGPSYTNGPSLSSTYPFPMAEDATIIIPTQLEPSEVHSYENFSDHNNYFSSSGVFTAVGSWMLGDWSADLDWMNEGTDA